MGEAPAGDEASKPAPTPMADPPRMSWLARLVAAIGAQVIYLLIRIFGRTHVRAELPWLDGPFGGDQIGEAPYQEAADAEGLTIDRQPADGGLLPSLLMAA
jgi:hypothetical protein